MCKPFLTFHCRHKKTVHLWAGLFLLLTLWAFVSHFGHLCWGRVSVQQLMNTLLHLRMTVVEEAGAAGAHPVKGTTEKSLAPRIKYLVTLQQTVISSLSKRSLKTKTRNQRRESTG